MLDWINDDDFGVVSLTNTLEKFDHIPGRVGELCFASSGSDRRAGVAEPINTTTAVIEERSESLTLLQTSARGSPAAQETIDKRTLRSVAIPHIKLEETINSYQIQGVRAFGSTDTLQGVQTVINQQLGKMARRFDLTMEHLRFGAIKGDVLDADSTSLANLFTLFGVTQETEVDFELDDTATDVRGKCAGVIRAMKRNAKTMVPSSARVHALCSDEFFDALISHANVKGVYDGWAAAERRLGESYVHGIFEFGGIFFENYQGTDDNSTVAVAANKVHFFWANVPGLYAEYYAPGDFMEAVNTIGLTRYAKIAEDSEFNRWVKLHVQSNPLPICLRPKTLMKGKKQ